MKTEIQNDCMERPRKVEAKFSGAQIAPDEFVQPDWILILMILTGNKTDGLVMILLNMQESLKNFKRLKMLRYNSKPNVSTLVIMNREKKLMRMQMKTNMLI